MSAFEPKISFVIPSYEAKGQGVFFLEKNIRSILAQTYTNIEIIVTDHSRDGVIEDYVRSLANDKIVYLRYGEHIGWPAYNTNNGIRHATGEYVKFMNLDDYIDGADTIALMVGMLAQGARWVLSGCKHLDYSKQAMVNPIIPQIEGDGRHLLLGRNYIGCPSVALVPAGELFDVDVVYMIDCELWYRMLVKYGPPAILQDFRIVVGIGDHTVTSQLSAKFNDMLLQDIAYCEKKYPS